MKNTFIYIAIAAMALASGCMDRNVPEIPGQNTVTLSLSFDAAPATRATGGVGLENAVTSVDYFFYTDTTQAAAYHNRVTNPTLGGTETNPEYVISFTAGEDGMPDLNTLFANGKCEFFAVFNAPNAIANASLETVKGTAVANSFAHQDGVQSTASYTDWVVTSDGEASDYPKYFVMTGQKTLNLGTTGNYAVQETVDMRRIAAKIGVTVNIPKTVTATDQTVWEPMIKGAPVGDGTVEGSMVRLYLSGAAGNAVIGGADRSEPSYPTDLGIFTYKDIRIDTADQPTVSDNNYVIESQQDFYTYPMTWTVGSDTEPFIKIILPWRRQGSTKEREIYYKVMIPVEKIAANTYYQLTVNLSVLGIEGDPEVELKPLSALVVDWQGGGRVNPTVSAAKYLSVERGVVETAIQNNVFTVTDDSNKIEFFAPSDGTSFAASDPVSVTILEIYQDVFKSTGGTTREYLYQNGSPVSANITKRGFSQADVQGWFPTPGGNYLQLGHQLNQDLTSPLMDVTPYCYTIVLSLPEDIDPRTTQYPYGEYAKTVRFVQWPDVYVVEDPNKSTNNNGYVFLNTYSRNSEFTSRYNRRDYTTILDTQYSVYDYLGGVHGLSGTNANPSMYVLTITVSDTYTIGDPRSTSVGNPSFTYTGYNDWQGTTHEFTGSWNSAPWYYGNNHTLTYYHPAANTSNTEEMIAPKIRIASSYGVSLPITEAKAIARCAAYQEDGIPAGRWRLPTFAEVQFISKLSAMGRIPYLFGSDGNENSYYWTANGQIVVNNGAQTAVKPTNEQNTAYIRCVYDEWYWGDATISRPVNASTFTWGDLNY